MPEFIQANVPGGAVEIRVVKHGEVITEPGVYDMPAGWYHSDCCAGPSISSTGLRTIVNKSPAHYWWDSYLNPDREEVEDAETKALRIGLAAHILLLEPHLFQERFTTRPASFPDYRTIAARKWRADQQLAGIHVLDPKEMQEVYGIRDSIQQHAIFRDGILDGDIERSLIWKDEATGIWIKTRPDVIPRGSNILADLKTTNDGRARAVSKKVFDMGYDMQMALIGIGMDVLLGRLIEEYVLVFVESSKPFGVRVAPIDLDDIGRGRVLLRHALTKLRQCLDAGRFPSFEEEDGEYVRRNEFAAKAIDADMKSGRLPKRF